MVPSDLRNEFLSDEALAKGVADVYKLIESRSATSA